MTLERKISNIYKLDDRAWLRHANPWSVWTRNTVMPLLILAFLEQDLDRMEGRGAGGACRCMGDCQSAYFSRTAFDRQLGFQMRLRRTAVAESR